MIALKNRFVRQARSGCFTLRIRVEPLGVRRRRTEIGTAMRHCCGHKHQNEFHFTFPFLLAGFRYQQCRLPGALDQELPDNPILGRPSICRHQLGGEQTQRFRILLTLANSLPPRLAENVLGATEATVPQLTIQLQRGWMRSASRYGAAAPWLLARLVDRRGRPGSWRNRLHACQWPREGSRVA
jgi:hypothetical protein